MTTVVLTSLVSQHKTRVKDLVRSDDCGLVV